MSTREQPAEQVPMRFILLALSGVEGEALLTEGLREALRYLRGPEDGQLRLATEQLYQGLYQPYQYAGYQSFMHKVYLTLPLAVALKHALMLAGAYCIRRDLYESADRFMQLIAVLIQIELQLQEDLRV